MRVFVVCLLLLAIATGAWAGPKVEVADYWLQGRASWYGNQGKWVDPFTASRGGGRSAFGVLEWGGCGLTNGDGNVLWPKEHVTAYATGNPDFPGACGRCYEVRCSPGTVLGWENKPVDFTQAYYPFWWHANVTDEMGRGFPGNAGESKKELQVKCWDTKQSVVVKYGCCYKQQNHMKAGQLELDLSFWAFQQLAHPEYGIMMVQYRPVDCDSKRPIKFDPGYISDVIYDDFPGVGWSWFASKFQDTNKFAVVDKGRGVGGGAASCAELKPGGGMSWACRQCGMKAGYQPFSGASSASFSIKDSSNSGNAPPMTLQLNNPDAKKACNTKIDLTSRAPNEKLAGGWLRYTIPMSEFGCSEGPDSMNQLSWDMKSGASGGVCLDDVRINRGGGVGSGNAGRVGGVGSGKPVSG